MLDKAISKLEEASRILDEANYDYDIIDCLNGLIDYININRN